MTDLFPALDMVLKAPDPVAAVLALSPVVARYFGFLTTFPLATWLNLGGVLRLAISFVLAMPEIVVQIPALEARHDTAFVLLLLTIGEALLGGGLGLLLGAPVWVAQGAGDIIDSYRGASATNTLDPMNAVETSNFGQLNAILVQTWMVESGVLRMDLDFMAQSFGSLRLGRSPDLLSSGILELARTLLADIAQSALTMAGPLLVLLLLADAALGVLGRISKHFQFDATAISSKSLVFYLSLPVYAGFLFVFADASVRELVSSVLIRLGPSP